MTQASRARDRQPTESLRLKLPPTPRDDTSPTEDRRRRRILKRALGVLLISLPIALGLLFLTSQMIYSQRFVPGVAVLDTDLSGLSPTDARTLLQRRLDAYLATPQTLEFAGSRWTATPREMGVGFDLDRTLDRAYALGHQADLLPRLGDQLRGLFGGHKLAPIPTVDNARQTAYWAGMAKQIDQPFVDSELRLEGTQVIASRPLAGRSLDQEKAAWRVRELATNLGTAAIALPVNPLQPIVTEVELAESKRKTESVLAAPYTITYSDTRYQWKDNAPVAETTPRRWELAPAQLASLILFQPETGPDGRKRLWPTLDREKLNEFGRGIAREVNQEPKEAKLSWKGNAQRDGLQVDEPSQEGRQVDLDSLIQRLRQAVAGDARQVELPVRVEKPNLALEELPSLGLKEQLTTITLSKPGSSRERAANIALGAKLLNGVVIKPGQLFSFNDIVGDTSQAAGFELGYAIVNNNTVPDYGGGICQVATAVFQNALLNGLGIVERHAHAYRITAYEKYKVGADATVYFPWVDLKFKNDSGNAILIQAASPQPGEVSVAFYGTKPNWEVKFETAKLENVVKADPKKIVVETDKLPPGQEVQIEAPEDGVDIRLVRIVSRDGKELERYTVESEYRPERNFWLIGKDPSKPTPPGVIGLGTPVPTPAAPKATPPRP